MNKKGSIDWPITLLPLVLVLGLSLIFFVFPQQAQTALLKLRAVFTDRLAAFYLLFGIFVLLLSFWLALSPYGRIVLGGQTEKPKYGFFVWGSMMFSAGLAADIIFYSLGEWILYMQERHVAAMGVPEEWASTYTLFHWGLIPWSFYLVLAAAFGFRLHVRKVQRQRYSEACRPLLGRMADSWPGRLIDLLAIFALLAGTATTFALATPLMTAAMKQLFHLQIEDKLWNMLVLLLTCGLYTFSLVSGIRGIALLARCCTGLFLCLLAYVFVFGGESRFIVENSLASLGRLADKFFYMASCLDPQHQDLFAQNWTVFYWAYWMVWCVAAPFFIGAISRGRTIRQTILGGYVFGVGATWLSFMVLGNYSLGLQRSGRADLLGVYERTQVLYGTILEALSQLPLYPLVLLLLFVCMLAFYASSFDAIALVAAAYSCKEYQAEPGRGLKIFWSLLLILLPLALIFSDNSMRGLQSVSILAAFPIGLVLLLMIFSFLKDAALFLKESAQPDDASRVER